jgi:hypothetical protein
LKPRACPRGYQTKLYSHYAAGSIGFMEAADRAIHAFNSSGTLDKVPPMTFQHESTSLFAARAVSWELEHPSS